MGCLQYVFESIVSDIINHPYIGASSLGDQEEVVQTMHLPRLYVVPFPHLNQLYSSLYWLSVSLALCCDIVKQVMIPTNQGVSMFIMKTLTSSGQHQKRQREPTSHDHCEIFAPLSRQYFPDLKFYI